MIDKNERMKQLADGLLAAFGGRLLFLGLQGSYRRGEATENSDFDAVVILDRLDRDDLLAYREVLDAMPDRDKACGFIGGLDEMRHWPRHELFQFRRDTEACHGDLDALLPPVSVRDVAESVNLAASAVYHGACHSYLHGRDGLNDLLRGMFKGCFFALVAAYFVRHGDYVGNKRELLERLEGDERAILALGMDWPEHPDMGELEGYVDLLLRWSGGILRKGEFDG